MPCLCPISIPDKGLAKFHVKSEILVPCGHCRECQRERVNAWFVRLYSYYMVREKLSLPTYFVTVTIDPRLWPNLTKDKVKDKSEISHFIRTFNERVRYVNGSSVTRFYVAEFGSLGRLYKDVYGHLRESTGALHFHGFIFSDVNLYELREALRDTHGYLWFTKLTDARLIRYAVKYIFKDLVHDDVVLRPRVFASPGLANADFYFHGQPPTSHVLINGYHYRTPRYFFDKFYRGNGISQPDGYSRILTLSRLSRYVECSYGLDLSYSRSTRLPLDLDTLVRLSLSGSVSVFHPTIQAAYRRCCDSLRRDYSSLSVCWESPDYIQQINQPFNQFINHEGVETFLSLSCDLET